MNDRFKFRIAVFERYNTDEWEFTEFIENNDKFGVSINGNVIHANVQGLIIHLPREKTPKNVCRTMEALQYTGLKDKNGKLIFEGDIVKSDFEFFTITINPLAFKVGDVVFSEHFGGWVINSKDKAAPYQQAHLGKIEAQNCEVIGNIYENKELLED